MDHRPSGTITFLFSDIEASTNRWEKETGSMEIAFQRQEAIIRELMSEHGGYVYKMIGDAFQVAFDTAMQALMAAQASQRVLQSESWGDIGQLKVRMALHTGVVDERGDDYVGPLLNRAARLMNAGHGGQVLLSQATYELVRDILPGGVRLRDLGEHRLKDLTRREHIYQLVVSDLETDFPPIKTLDSHPNNLPLEMTSFVGREQEIEEVKSLLEINRLITLIGPGGAGKTRLALHLAADLLEDFNQGVWLVDLAAMNDPERVTQAVAGVLSVRDETQRPLIETLSEHVRDKDMLLILDSCEHIVKDCARLSDELLRASPGLKILATSREALRIGGEHTYPVLSLDTPDPMHMPVLEELSQFDAVRLFIDRAVAVSPSFMVDNANAPAVAEICYRLDGIPLAIELAAARVGVLPIEVILARLDDRFRLLSKGDRAVLPRHQTLAAVIDWSYDLLTNDECMLFRRLGVFIGGWSLEAAESVCCGKRIEECAIFELLTGLVERSLVQMDHSNQEIRYRMLETVRQYALDKAISASETEKLQNRYVHYFLDLVEEGEQKANREYVSMVPKQLAVDLENFRAALNWSFQDPAAYGDAGLRMAGSLWVVWWTIGYLNEGRDWLEKAIREFPSLGAPRAKVLTNAGCITWQQGDYQIAGEYLTKAIEIYHDYATDDRGGLANALHMYGHVVFDQQDYLEARKIFEASLLIFREIKNQPLIVTLDSDIGNIDYHEGDYSSAKVKYEECLEVSREMGDQSLVAANLLRLGNIYRLEGDYERACILYEESLVSVREMEWNLELASNLHHLGYVAQFRGNYQEAAELFSESLEMQQDMGNKQGIAECLAGLAGLAVASGKFKEGVRLFAATEEFLNEFGAPLGPADRAEWERDLSIARDQLDKKEFPILWSDGADNTFDQTISQAKAIAGLLITQV
ncbi:MAG: tetratricopeptide repeat protein [Anaerolineales bacterium]